MAILSPEAPLFTPEHSGYENNIGLFEPEEAALYISELEPDDFYKLYEMANTDGGVHDTRQRDVLRAYENDSGKVISISAPGAVMPHAESLGLRRLTLNSHGPKHPIREVHSLMLQRGKDIVFQQRHVTRSKGFGEYISNVRPMTSEELDNLVGVIHFYKGVQEHRNFYTQV